MAEEAKTPLTQDARGPLAQKLDAPAQLEIPLPPQQDEIESLEKWGTKEVAAYFEKRHLINQVDGKNVAVEETVWVKHEITGERLILLTAEDIKALGIYTIGDRLGIQREVEILKVEARKHMRNKEVMPPLYEAFDGSSIGLACSTCCGFFPRDPDKYTLTQSALRIEGFEVPRICGVWKCTCLGGKHHMDNIALDQVRDVDTVVSKYGCCCFAVNKCRIIIAVAAGNSAEGSEARVVNKEMFVEDNEGEDFANSIFMAIEQYKNSFRKTANSGRV